MIGSKNYGTYRKGRGQNIDHLYSRNNITRDKVYDFFRDYIPSRFFGLRLSNQYEWRQRLVCEDSEAKTRFSINHGNGFVALQCPYSYLTEKDKFNIKKIQNKMDELVGVTPCCSFEKMYNNSIIKVYVYPDGLPSDQLFQIFEGLSKNRGYWGPDGLSEDREVWFLKRLDSKPYIEPQTDIEIRPVK